VYEALLDLGLIASATIWSKETSGALAGKICD